MSTVDASHYCRRSATTGSMRVARPAGRYDARQQGDDAEQRGGSKQHNRVGRSNVIELTLQPAAESDCGEQPDGKTDRQHDKAFLRDQLEDFAGAAPECDKNATASKPDSTT